MGDKARESASLVTTRLAAREYAALAGAAKRAGVPVPELVRVFITFCLDRLEAGDAALQRAVKGSRDAAVH